MILEEYLRIRNNPKEDTMPALYFYYSLCVKKRLSYEDFKMCMGVWIFNVIGIRGLGKVIEYTFYKLDLHFNLK